MARKPKRKKYEGPLGRPWKPGVADVEDWAAGRDKAVWVRRWERVLGLLIDHYGLNDKGHRARRERGDFGLFFRLAAHLAHDHVPLARDLHIPDDWRTVGRPRAEPDSLTGLQGAALIEASVAIAQEQLGRSGDARAINALAAGLRDRTRKRRDRARKR